MTRFDSQIKQHLGAAISSRQQLGGGDFAEAWHCTLTDGRQLFIKSHSNPPAHFFSTEAAGLRWLRASGDLHVPAVLLVSDDPPLLALEWIEQGRPDSRSDASFGQQLACLHQRPFECFGRPDQRTTGSLALPNTPASHHWADFYANCRLLPLARLAHQRSALCAIDIKRIEAVAARLSEFASVDEPAALLHGDLWAGNRIVDTRARSWIIDPAAHGGHREFDLAMMRLFGGYGEACFAAYEEQYPLADGWQQRVALHQLAPLIVHAIKFGGHYASAVQDALRNYC